MTRNKQTTITVQQIKIRNLGREIEDFTDELSRVQDAVDQMAENLGIKAETIQALHGQLEGQAKAYNKQLSIMERDSKERVENTENTLRMLASLFLKEILDIVEELGKSPNKKPLEIAISKINDLVQEKVQEINDIGNDPEDVGNTAKNEEIDKE